MIGVCADTVRFWKETKRDTGSYWKNAALSSIYLLAQEHCEAAGLGTKNTTKLSDGPKPPSFWNQCFHPLAVSFGEFGRQAGRFRKISPFLYGGSHPLDDRHGVGDFVLFGELN